ncbi:MAG: regulatory protein GemA [Methylococcales bacterium]
MAIKKIISGNPDPYRNKELAKIHAMKKQLNFDDETYRAVLGNQTGLNSAALLNRGQRLTVIKHFQEQLGKSLFDGKPHNLAQNKQLQKIEALLTVQKNPWSYAHAIAKRMYKKANLTFCTPFELRGVITALVKVGAKESS